MDRAAKQRNEAAIDADLEVMVANQHAADAKAGQGDSISPLHAVRLEDRARLNDSPFFRVAD